MVEKMNWYNMRIRYMLYRINIEILENGESSLIYSVPNSIHFGLYWFTISAKTHLSSTKDNFFISSIHFPAFLKNLGKKFTFSFTLILDGLLEW